MAKIKIEIKDFELFYEAVKTTSKVIESAKFSISNIGMEVYGARARTARCEITTNAVISESAVSFSIENLSMFLKLLSTVKEVHGDDFSGLKFFVDLPFIRFESKKFKTKFSTCNEDLISKWITTKISAQFKPIFEFTSSSDMIKRLNSQAFMFSTAKDMRIYLETKDDMENNAVFATIGNKETDLNNEITLKFGLVSSGGLIKRNEDNLVIDERSLILDFERLNLFNATQSDSIKFQLMDVNCLVSKISIAGKNGSFFNFDLYCTVLKN
jgi:hypothetical protein